METCPCGSSFEYASCCEPYILGQPAPTAEKLMRSRYTAFTIGDLGYIERTCTEHASSSFNRIDMERAIVGTEWLGLEIRKSDDLPENGERAQVHFAFRYRNKGRIFTQVEKAEFLCVDGKWLYNDSEINPKTEPVSVLQIGRNDPCPCGSGKKYKKCCGANAD